MPSPNSLDPHYVDNSTMPVIAAAARTEGQAVREGGWNGVVPYTVVINELYALEIKGIKLFALAGNPALGSLVYITSGNTLTATSSGNTLYAKVYGTPVTMPEKVPTGYVALELIQP